MDPTKRKTTHSLHLPPPLSLHTNANRRRKRHRPHTKPNRYHALLPLFLVLVLVRRGADMLVLVPRGDDMPVPNQPIQEMRRYNRPLRMRSHNDGVCVVQVGDPFGVGFEVCIESDVQLSGNDSKMYQSVERNKVEERTSQRASQSSHPPPTEPSLSYQT